MDGKTSFGLDFIYLMRDLILRGSKELDPKADAAARFFLLFWDFSVDEIDNVNKIFWDRIENNKFDDLEIVSKRISEHLKSDRIAQERFITQLAAIGYLDYNVQEGERFIVQYFSDNFDFRPSEMMSFAEKGSGIAIGLNFFGEEYCKAKQSQ